MNTEQTSKNIFTYIKFSVSKKDHCAIERQNNICFNVFCYENNLAYPVYLSDVADNR